MRMCMRMRIGRYARIRCIVHAHVIDMHMYMSHVMYVYLCLQMCMHTCMYIYLKQNINMYMCVFVCRCICKCM